MCTSPASTLPELASWGLGLAGVVWWGAFQVGVARATRHNLERFEQLQHFALPPTAPDQSLWAPETQLNAWRKALLEPALIPSRCFESRSCNSRWRCCLALTTARSTVLSGASRVRRCRAPTATSASPVTATVSSEELKDIAPGDMIEVDTPRGEGRSSRRANLDRQSGGCLGARPDAHARADAGHLLSLLLRLLRGPTVHRPGRARGASRAGGRIDVTSQSNRKPSRRALRNGESLMTRAMTSGRPGGGNRLCDGRRLAGAADVGDERKPRRASRCSRWTATRWSSGSRKAGELTSCR